jgi:hypothetical protein
MRQLSGLLSVPILVLLGGASAAAQPARVPTEELLSHVRPEHRAHLPEQLGVPSIEALPRYDLHLSIAPDLHGFGLREGIEVTNTEDQPLTDVVLRIFVNATPPEGMGPQVLLVGGRCLDEVSCQIEQPSPTVITVTPAQPIAPGARLFIELDLQGQLEAIDPSRTGMLAQGLEGMSAFEAGGESHGYGLLAHDGSTATLAAFFPVLARRTARRWITDDHGTTGDLGTDQMANVLARVVVPEAFVVAATGETDRRRPVRDPAGHAPRAEVTIHAGAIRDFALVVGASLETSVRDVGGVLVRSVYASSHAEAGARVLEAAAAAMEIYERRFGPYPYTALDVVEAPLVGGAGGVEFSSLVTVASMFYDDVNGGLGGLSAMLGSMGGDALDDLGGGLGGATELTSSMLEFVTAHEVAHQWWHGIVGSDSREHPVTDEALAQWSAVLYMEERYGTERAATEAERQVALNYVMMRVNGFADAAADQPASAFDPPVTYAGIVYGKAPFLWIRLRERLGDEAFFAGISTYVARYRMGIAPPDALLEILANAASRADAREVRRLGRRYLSERHGDEDLGPISEDRMLTSMLGVDTANFGEGTPMRTMFRVLMSSLRAGGLDGHGGDDGPLGDLLPGADGEMDEAALEEALGEMMGGMDAEDARELLEGMGEEGEGAPSSRRPTRVTP